MTDQTAPGARHPDYIRAVFERSVAMIEAGRLDGADVLLKTLSGEPSAEEAVSYLRGVIAARLGEREAAQILFKTALELNPHNADAHAQLGALLLEERPVSAAAAFAAALALDAGRADGHFGFAEALRRLGFVGFARDSYDEAAARGHAGAAQATAGLSEQDDPRAAEELSPEDASLLSDALFSEATRRFCAGDAARAKVMYERVLDRAPSHLFTLCNLGALERTQGDLVRSQALLERAIEIDGAFVPARLALGETHVAAGHAREARTQFSKAIELEPQSAAPHAAFAMALQKLRAPKEAIEHFHRAIMIDQNQSAEFYASLGAALEAMGLRDRAEIALQHAAALAQAS
jgi:tetratricopeptide (TPR) repeat protein